MFISGSGGAGGPGCSPGVSHGDGGKGGDNANVSTIDVIPGGNHNIVIGAVGAAQAQCALAIGQYGPQGMPSSALDYTMDGGDGGIVISSGVLGSVGESTYYMTSYKIAGDGGGGAYTALGGYGYGAGGGGGASANPYGNSGAGATGYVAIFADGTFGEDTPAFTADPTTGPIGTVVHFTDESIIRDPVGVIYLWDFGDGTTSITQGDVEHAYSAVGSYTVKLTIASQTTTLTLTKEAYIIVNLDNPPQPQSYPKYFTVHVLKGFGEPVEGATVSMTAISTSIGDYTNIAALLGIPLEEVAINETMSITTDSTGKATFYVIPTTLYNLTTTDPTYTFNPMTITPTEDDIIVWATGAAGDNYFQHGVDELEAVNISVTTAKINSTASWVNISYNDTTGHTTGGSVSVFQKNATPYGSPVTLASWPATSSVWNNSTVVSHTTQVSGYVETDVTSSQFGNITRLYPYSFKGQPVSFLGFGQEIALLAALGIMLLTAMLAGATHARQVVFVMAIEGWMFFVIGMFQGLVDRGVAENTIVFALIVITVMGVVANMEVRKKREKY